MVQQQLILEDNNIIDIYFRQVSKYRTIKHVEVIRLSKIILDNTNVIYKGVSQTRLRIASILDLKERISEWIEPDNDILPLVRRLNKIKKVIDKAWLNNKEIWGISKLKNKIDICMTDVERAKKSLILANLRLMDS